jgi:hypothetical protein
VLFNLLAGEQMIPLWTGSKKRAHSEKNLMHDLLIALAFIGMVIAPAIVAAKSGSENAEEAD